MVIIATSSSKAPEAAAGLVLVMVLCVAAVSVFRNRSYTERAPLVVGAIALSLVYNSVRDGSTRSLWFIPPIILVLLPSLFNTLKRSTSDQQSDDQSGT